MDQGDEEEIPKEETNQDEKDILNQEFEKVRKQKFESDIQAWEDKKKIKVKNKAQRRMANTDEWEKEMKASHEAESKLIETQVEKMKQLKLEKHKNKEAQIQRTINEKKAAIELQKVKSILKIKEKSQNHRSTGTLPTRCCGLCKD